MNEEAADLNDVRVFVAVVRQRGFTAAGRELQLPRSTVSRQVARLERQLNVRLLHRTTRKLKLTEEGSTYYERCAAALESLAEAESLIRQAQATPKGLVRLTAPHDIGHQLAPLLADFLREHGEVRISLDLSQRMIDLVAEGYDIAIRASSALPDSSLVAKRVGSGQAALMASQHYLDQRGTPKRPEDLARHATIALGLRTHQPSWTLQRKGETVTVPLDPALFVNDPGFARTSAGAGLGIAFLPIGAQRASDAPLVRVLADWSLPGGGGLYVVVPSAKHQTAAVRALRDYLHRRLSEVWKELTPPPAPGRAKLVAKSSRSRANR